MHLVLFPDAGGRRPKPRHRAARAESRRRQCAVRAALARRALPDSSAALAQRRRYLCNYAYWRGLEALDATCATSEFVHIPAVRLKHGTRLKPALIVIAALVHAAEALLVALIAASRRQRACEEARLKRLVSLSSRRPRCRSSFAASAHEARQRRPFGGFERQETRDDRRHDGLRGTAGAVVAFDGDAETLLRQRAAIDAFGAGLHEHPRAEKLMISVQNRPVPATYHGFCAQASATAPPPWRAQATRRGRCRIWQNHGRDFAAAPPRSAPSSRRSRSSCRQHRAGEIFQHAAHLRCTGCSGRK